jgi:hypothetical protein
MQVYACVRARPFRVARKDVMTEQTPQDPFSQPGQGQGQPFGEPGGQQPFGEPGGQQPPPVFYGGYSPDGWRPRQRGRRRNRGALIVAGTFAAIAIGGAVAAAHHSDTETPQVNVTPFSAPSKSAKTPIGSAIVLTGNSAGEKVAVTVVKVFAHARPASDFDTAQQGDRLYAVQFRLENTGSVAYTDAPSNGAVVVDSSGQSHQASVLSNVADCASLPAADHITAGDSGLGCIVFSVPAAARITLVEFTLDSGFGPQTGQWEVRG